jgi:hypothetical protein
MVCAAVLSGMVQRVPLKMSGSFSPVQTAVTESFYKHRYPKAMRPQRTSGVCPNCWLHLHLLANTAVANQEDL